MTDNQDMKESLLERAREISKIIAEDSFHMSAVHIHREIEKALLQFAQEFAEEQGKAVRQRTIEEIRELAKDHYWDSLDKTLAIKHVEGILSLLPNESPQQPKKEME